MQCSNSDRVFCAPVMPLASSSPLGTVHSTVHCVLKLCTTVGHCINLYYLIHTKGPVWFTEFVGNTQVRSDGIALLDVPRISSKNGVNQNDCPVYGGVYVRWSVIRRNSIAGISLAQSREKRCGSVSNNNKNSTDLISEHNIIDCPVGGTTINANGKGLNWTDVRCDHGCLTRP